MIKQFIRASAGTGKTHTLLQTIFKYDKNKRPTVSYETACNDINKSVFLTFSNSAAEEIRSRIYKGLAQCDGRPETDLIHALAQQDVRIRVYTIHAFALEMLRLFRYKLCLPTELNFADEDEPLWGYCVKEFFAKNWNQKSLRELLGITPADKTMYALADVFFFLTNRGNIQGFIEEKGDTLYFLAAMGKSFCFDVPNRTDEVQALLKNLGLDADGDYSEPLLQARNRLADIKDSERYKTGKQVRENEIAEKEADLEELEQKQKNGEKLKGKDSEKLRDLPKEIAILKQELDLYLKDAAFLQKLCPVLDTCSYFIEQMVLAIGKQLYMPRMMAEGIFDFDAVVFLFIKELLRGNISEMQGAGVNAFLNELKAEGQSFERLYIDEAQDNDIIQNYLIVLFGQGKCPVEVYVVGDLKQSIYTWRNAYPREFEQMLKECSQSSNRAEILQTLRTSYRLKEQNTCGAINGVCTAIEAKCPEWWYDPAEDNLGLPDNTAQTHNGRVEMWYTSKGQISLTASPDRDDGTEPAKNTDQLAELDAFFTSGKTAVAVRSRNQLSAVPDLKYKLKELRANYKMDKEICDAEKAPGKGKGNDPAKADTLQPELEIIVLLFMALTDEHAGQVPFALFWSEAGKLLAQRLSLCGGETMSAAFKDIFEKIYGDIAHGVAGNRVERVLDLFDKYNLWTHLCHTDLSDEENKPQDLRRTFCHILMRAQLAEDKHGRRAGNAFFTDPVWTIIRKGKVVRSCFSIPDYAAPLRRKENPAPDVITIHGSKGLAYDNMIVVADFKDNFFGNTEDFGLYKYGPVYSQLFSADFKRILSTEPEIGVSYFPYLGLMPAYLLKNKDADTRDSFWKKLDENYTNIKNLVRSEQLNLLYVALTRTAKNILLLDIRPVYNSKGADEEVQAIHALFAGAGVDVKEVGGESRPQDPQPPEVRYQYQDVAFERMDIGANMPTHSVRSQITGKIYRKYGGSLSCLDRFNHAKKGSMVHNVMQRLIGQAKDAADFMSKAQTLCRNTPPENTLYAQAVQLVAANGNAVTQNADLFGNYTFYHEVPVWQFNAESGTLTKGSIDTLAVGPEKAVIVEYKVLFNRGHSQQVQAQEQMKIYERMLRALEQDYAIEKRAVELKE